MRTMRICVDMPTFEEGTNCRGSTHCWRVRPAACAAGMVGAVAVASGGFRGFAQASLRGTSFAVHQVVTAAPTGFAASSSTVRDCFVGTRPCDLRDGRLEELRREARETSESESAGGLDAEDLSVPVPDFIRNLIAADDTPVAVGETVEIETPLSSLIVPETPVSGDEELETPLESLFRSETIIEEDRAVEFATPLAELFQNFGLWSEEPSDGEAFVNASDESNYFTVALQKPLGIEFVENTEDLGGGVQTGEVRAGSSAANSGIIDSGYQLIAVGSAPVYGLPLSEAVKPIVDSDGLVRLTFFKGGADFFYGYLGPNADWLSSFMEQLKIQELEWVLQEGPAPRVTQAWVLALEVLEGRRRSGKPASADTYTSAVLACEQGAQWERAVGLLGEMRQIGLMPPSSTFVSAMRACEQAARWAINLSLLSEMRELAVAPDAVAYRATVGACDRGGQQVRALRLVEEMRAQGLQPDVVVLSIACGACRAKLRTYVKEAKGLSWDQTNRGRRRKVFL